MKKEVIDLSKFLFMHEIKSMFSKARQKEAANYVKILRILGVLPFTHKDFIINI